MEVTMKLRPLASGLPRDMSTFYDDVHFNESGARRVASVLAEEMMKLPTD
jgi:hypothetical protein